VLNHLGRPAEFHCTLPVRASRAQEILYGVTLQAYLYGELIAQTLIQKSKIKPAVVLTNMPQILAVQEFIDIPAVYVADHPNTKDVHVFDPEVPASHDNETSEPQTDHLTQTAETSVLDSKKLPNHQVGRYNVAMPELALHSSAETENILRGIVQTIDFLEPFERIRLAVEEAQKAA
jgi:hypothetical protein